MENNCEAKWNFKKWVGIWKSIFLFVKWCQPRLAAFDGVCARASFCGTWLEGGASVRVAVLLRLALPCIASHRQLIKGEFMIALHAKENRVNLSAQLLPRLPPINVKIKLAFFPLWNLAFFFTFASKTIVWVWKWKQGSFFGMFHIVEIKNPLSHEWIENMLVFFFQKKSPDKLLTRMYEWEKRFFQNYFFVDRILARIWEWKFHALLSKALKYIFKCTSKNLIFL